MTKLNGEAGQGEEGAEVLDPELVRMGCAYLSALNLIGQLRKLAVSDGRYWDRFGACIFCSNHMDKGHVEGCLIVESQKALVRYDEEQRNVSASSSPQRAFGQIREAAQAALDAITASLQGFPPVSRQEIESIRDELRVALLGEAPPTSGEAEQSHQVTNHKEAFELAQIKKAKSNLARCYLELREATPGATVQPQARPMKLEAVIDNQRAKNNPNIRIFREVERPWGRDASYVASVSCGWPEIIEEIAYRINSFEPPHQGEAT